MASVSTTASSAADIAAALAVDHLDNIVFELALPRHKDFDERRIRRALNTVAMLAKGSDGDIPGATGHAVRAAAADHSCAAIVQLMSPRTFSLATRKAAMQVVHSLSMADVDVEPGWAAKWAPSTATQRQGAVGHESGLLERLVGWLQHVVAAKEAMSHADARDQRRGGGGDRSAAVWRRRGGVSEAPKVKEALKAKPESRSRSKSKSKSKPPTPDAAYAVWTEEELDLCRRLCLALRGLCVDAENVAHLATKVGAVPPLLTVVKHAPPDCAQAAAGCLIPIAIWRPQMVTQHGGIEAVCQMLHHADQPLSWLCAANILSHLASSDAEKIVDVPQALQRLVLLATQVATQDGRKKKAEGALDRVAAKTRMGALWALARLTRSKQLRDRIMSDVGLGPGIRSAVLSALKVPRGDGDVGSTLREAALVLLMHVCRREECDDELRGVIAVECRENPLLAEAVPLVALCLVSKPDGEAVRARAAECLMLGGSDSLRLAAAFGAAAKNGDSLEVPDAFSIVFYKKPPPPPERRKTLLASLPQLAGLGRRRAKAPSSGDAPKARQAKAPSATLVVYDAPQIKAVHDALALFYATAPLLRSKKKMVLSDMVAGVPRETRYDVSTGELSWETFYAASGKRAVDVLKYDVLKAACQDRAIELASEQRRVLGAQLKDDSDRVFERLVRENEASLLSQLQKPSDAVWINFTVNVFKSAAHLANNSHLARAGLPDRADIDAAQCWTFSVEGQIFLLAVHGDDSEKVREAWVALPAQRQDTELHFNGGLKRSKRTAPAELDPFVFEDCVKASIAITPPKKHADVLGFLFGRVLLDSRQSSTFYYRAVKVALHLVCHPAVNKSVRVHHETGLLQLSRTLRAYTYASEAELDTSDSRRHLAILQLKVQLLTMLGQTDALERRLSDVMPRYLETAKKAILTWRKYLGYTALSSVVDGFLPEALNKLQHLFAEIDEDSSGYISAEELQKLFKKMKLPTSKAQVVEIIDEVDLDGNGLVDFDEFLLVVKNMANMRSVQSKLGVALGQASAAGVMRHALGDTGAMLLSFVPGAGRNKKKKMVSALESHRREHAATEEASLTEDARKFKAKTLGYAVRRKFSVAEWSNAAKRAYRNAALEMEDGEVSFLDALETIARDETLVDKLGFVRGSGRLKPHRGTVEAAEFEASMRNASNAALLHKAAYSILEPDEFPDPSMPGWVYHDFERALWLTSTAFRKDDELKGDARRNIVGDLEVIREKAQHFSLKQRVRRFADPNGNRRHENARAATGKPNEMELLGKLDDLS